MKLYFPIAVIYFARITASYTLGLSVLSIAMLTSAVCQLPTGIFSDQVGRKRSLMLGSFLAIFAVIAYTVTGKFYILIIGAMLDGLSQAFFSGNNEALLYELTAEANKEKEFHHFFGKVSAWTQGAITVAALISGFVAQQSFLYLMLASIVFQIIAFITTFFIIEAQIQREQMTLIQHIQEIVQTLKANKHLRALSIADASRFATSQASYQLQSVFYNLLLP